MKKTILLFIALQGMYSCVGKTDKPKQASTENSPNKAELLSTPLKGVIDHRPFIPQSAIALLDVTRKATIHIADTQGSCSDWPVIAGHPGARKIVFEVPWSAPRVIDFSQEGQVQFSVQKGDTQEAELVFSGLVELLQVPIQDRSKAPLRMHVVKGDTSVQGQIEVEVCRMGW